jgi:hypothetical protein
MTEEEKMKRSEMILAIDRQFPTLHIECDIDQLLQFLQSQGMQPPAIPKEYVFDDSGEGAVVMFNEWEPEITQETIDQALEHIGKKGLIGKMEITE